MIFNTKTVRQEYEEKNHWHVVFALWPRRLNNGKTVWLQKVWRRATLTSLEDYGGMVYEYELVKPDA